MDTEDEKLYKALQAQLTNALSVTRASTEAVVHSVEVQSNARMAQQNPLQSLYYVFGIAGALLLVVLFVFETRGGVQNNVNQIAANQQYNREEQARQREYTKELEARIRALENGGVRSK